MGNRRRQRGRNYYYHQETMQQQGTGSRTGKPPLANSKKDSVAAWEKDFCTIVGSVPWWKVREADRLLFMYDKIAQWDDSAGEEAFKNSKARFWAKINDLPCDIPLPDPNIHIDDVDWDAEVDPELMLDLERDPEDSGNITKNEQVVILDTNILFGPYTGTGWGPEWEDTENGNNNNCGDGENKPENHWEWNYDGWNDDSWGIDKNCSPHHISNGFQNKNTGYTRSDTENSWEQNFDGWNENFWGRNKKGYSNHIINGGFHHKNTNYNTENAWEQNFSGWNDYSWGKYKNGSRGCFNNGFQQKNVPDYGNGRNRGRWEWSRKKKSEGLNGNGPGFNSPRFQREDYSKDCRWRNGRGRGRGSFQNHSNNWVST